MDDRDGNMPRSVLHTSFTHTANALASLYKQALMAERDARDTGARSAYQNIMQWAARRSRNGGSISVADLISLCAAELTKIPPPTTPTIFGQPPSSSSFLQSSNEKTNTRNSNLVNNNNSTFRSSSDMILDSSTNSIQQQPHHPQENSVIPYIARDEGLVSDIKKLNVNPRKRQRIEISEAFMRACGSVDNAGFLFSDEYGHSRRSPERSPSLIGQPDIGRRDGRENRDSAPPSSGTTESAVPRSGKGNKSQNHDKQRKK